MSDLLTVRAHAKINLSLRVGPRRPDGFHELRTVYQTLALHDTLTFVRRTGPLSLVCRAPGVPVDADNLVVKAAHALWRKAGRAGESANIRAGLRKRIPTQAGLGGGSADAAATLVALNRLWKLRLGLDALLAVAASLGSDVPFFLIGGTAMGLGRGEIVQALPDAPPRAVVLVHPRVGVSTAEAYDWFDQDDGSSRAAEAGRAPGTGVNDLEAPVVRRHPEVGAARAALREAGALAAGMSGSGSAVFGLFGSPARARRAAERLRRGGWVVTLTRTLSRADYARLARPRLVRRGAR
jgi:4-diphosphocytidyl-2-C-methyl-D-erythritol kinase